MYAIRASSLSDHSVLSTAVWRAVGSGIAFSGGDAGAQQKQRVSYKVTPENAKYTQQQFVDVGDVPGHQVRSYEIFRTFPSNAPAINGIKVKETWTRGISDYIDGNGSSTTYGVMVMENGDKIFTKSALVAQNDGGGKLTVVASGPITGGTGKFGGIQGITRSVTKADPKAGFNEVQTDLEYWMPQ
jgi:hypothetical protein